MRSIYFIKTTINDILKNTLDIIEPLHTNNCIDQELLLNLALIYEEIETREKYLFSIVNKINEVYFSLTYINLTYFYFFNKSSINDLIKQKYNDLLEDEDKYNQILLKKINIIDYSNFIFLQDSKYSRLYDIFKKSNNSLIIASLTKDFPLYCFYISRQIEALISINSKKIKKKAILNEYINNIKNYERCEISIYENYKKNINFIFDIRDFICHIDSFGSSINQKIKQRHGYIKLLLENLREDIKDEEIYDAFKIFISNHIKDEDLPKYIRINKLTSSDQKPKLRNLKSTEEGEIKNPNMKRYMVILSNVDIQYFHAHSYISDIIKDEAAYKSRFGNQFTIQDNSEETNEEKELRDFRKNADFHQVLKLFLWILEKQDIMYKNISREFTYN